MKKQYILTSDLEKKFQHLHHLGIKTPNLEKYFKKFRRQLIEKIKDAIPDGDVFSIGIGEISSKVLNIATEKQLGTQGLIISTSPDFSAPKRGATLEINRLADITGQIIGHGPRPGFQTLDDQFRNISNQCMGRPVIVVEDGSFSGSTVVEIIKRLRERKIKIAAVIVGFSFPEGLEKIKSVFDGEIIAINKLENLIDWVPDHDFFPFAPNCGRVLGFKLTDKNILPYYDAKGMSHSFPYILPFAPMEKWTSIPQSACYPISHFCLQSAIGFYKEVEKINSRDILIKDVMGINPRISSPICVEPTFLLDNNTKIVSYLTSVINEL